VLGITRTSAKTASALVVARPRGTMLEMQVSRPPRRRPAQVQPHVEASGRMTLFNTATDCWTVASKTHLRSAEFIQGGDVSHGRTSRWPLM